jgi:transposase-like protein
MTKRLRKVYSEETKQKALQIAESLGPKAASAQTGVNINTLTLWRRRQRRSDGAEKAMRRHYSDTFRKEAVALAAKLKNISAAAKLLEMPALTLGNWCNKNSSEQPKKHQRYYTKDVREKLVSRVEAEGDLNHVARDMDVPLGTAYNWYREAHGAHRKTVQHMPEVKERALALLRDHTIHQTSKALGISYDVVRGWRREAHGEPPIKRRSPPISAAQKREILEFAEAEGIDAACDKFKVDRKSLKSWCARAGVIADDGRVEQVNFDRQLKWMERDFPKYKLWRTLAVEWIATAKKGLSSRLIAIRKLVQYLARVDAPAEPAAFLFNARRAVDFRGVECSAKSYGATLANFAHEFVDWVLLKECSAEDDYGDLQVSPAFKNPFGTHSSPTSRNGQTVYSALPYGYIKELRGMIAGGPTFRDWIFAQGALGTEIGQSGAPAPDWFEVNPELVDTSDPDCVYRWREKIRGARVLEMWSPVRWVGLLIKMILPLRNFQVSVLDSGESDDWIYSSSGGCDKVWQRNSSSLSRSDSRRTWQQGFLRRVTTQQFQADGAGPATTTVLYVNTNKTADSGLEGPSKGYIIPWVDDEDITANPFLWAEKLRNWQSKYNPITSRTSWTELKGKHITTKSDAQIAGYPDACFLFRLPEAKDGERHLPMPKGCMDPPWICLLEAFEERLSARGEQLASGEALSLISKINKRPLFPLHALRVSIITALATDGRLSLATLQKLVGHSRLLMTIYYVNMGPVRIITELSDALSRLENETGIAAFLQNASREELEAKAIFNDSSSGILALGRHPAARNPAGWMEMHIGMCLVGGNTSPVEDESRVGGCFNGGPGIGTPSRKIHGPVPGGARNCVRCRWFVTMTRFLHALVSHFNVLMYHRSKAEDAYREHSDRLLQLQSKRLIAEEAHMRIDTHDLNLLRQEERLLTKHMSALEERTADADACLRLIERCDEKLRKGDGEDAIIAVGTERDIKLALEPVKSELLFLSSVCEAAEVYPDIDPGKAILERSQILDAAMLRENRRPSLLLLSEFEQLRVGNAMMRHMAKMCDPENPVIGMKKVAGLIDARRHLGELADFETTTISALERPVSLLSLVNA